MIDFIMNFPVTIMLRLVILVVVLIIVLISFQELIIFPGVSLPFSKNKGARRESEIPNDFKSTFVTTPDGKRIEVWKSDSSYPTDKKRVAIFFHGNGETLDSSTQVQKWLNDLGITTYSFDYRGYGRSTGWPSEQGIYTDSEAVFDLVSREEPLAEKGVVGWSIGTGFALYLAEKHDLKFAVLFAPYTSIRAIAREHPIYRFIPGLRYNIPSIEYLQKLKPDTCVIVSHGKSDTIIPFHHSVELVNAATNLNKLHFLQFEGAGHFDIFEKSKQAIGDLLKDCLNRN